MLFLHAGMAEMGVQNLLERKEFLFVFLIILAETQPKKVPFVLFNNIELVEYWIDFVASDVYFSTRGQSREGSPELMKY